MSLARFLPAPGLQVLARGGGLVLAALLVGAVAPAAGQVPDPGSGLSDPTIEAPRIGLILGGGGARGAAHVGVLKVLEEYGVPVHAIAGTSMGAIVGALYATGLTPAELEAELAAIDWIPMLSDRLPRTALPFRRREEDREFLTQLELPVGWRGPRLPSGLVAGLNVEARLARLLLPAAGIRDFDRLAVPFRATATDLETGELVVLGAGDLAMAVRASLSIPALFGPVELDGRLLVDGGVARNLPADVARDLGVDLVIAVDVGTTLAEREHLGSLLDVTRQLIHIITHVNTVTQRDDLGESDVLLTPDLGGIGILDFHRWEEAVAAGEAAARAMEAALRPLAIPPAAYTALLESQRAPFRGPIGVDSVHLVPVPGVPAAAARWVREAVRGGEVDPAALEEAILRLHGLRLLGHVHIRVEENGGAAVLVVEPEPRPGPASALRFGLTLEDDLGAGLSNYSVLASLWLRQLNRQGGEARVDLQAGEPRGALVEVFQPVAAGSPLFVTARGSYREADGFVLLEPGAPSRTLRGAETTMTAQIGAHPGLAGLELRAGLQRWHVRPEASGAATEVGVTAAVTLDFLGDAAFPRHGALARLAWAGFRTGLGGASSYDRLEASLAYARGIGRHTLVAGAEAAARTSGVPPHDAYGLGGPFRLTGRPPGSLAGHHGGLVRMVYLYDLGDARFHLGFSAEAGLAWARGAEPSFNDVVPAGSLLLAARTLVGPVFLVVGHAAGGSPTFYLSVGRSVAMPR
jgi:NTE family protein